MPSELEFKKDEKDICAQKSWIKKLSDSLEENCGEEVKNIIMEGIPADPDADQEKFSDYTINILNKMDTILPQEVKKQVLVDCACHYPLEKLQHIKDDYQNYRSSGKAHTMLEELFKEELKLSGIKESYKKEILDRGWGMAGKKVKEIVVITTIPQEVDKYFTATDDKDKRSAYCHCPRIKKIIETNGQMISDTYCYCGAGHYKGIWEEITGKNVKVEVLQTVLSGSETCKFSLFLDE